MGSGKAIATVFFAFGLLLVGGAAAVGLRDVSVDDPTRPQIGIAQEAQPAQNLNTTRVEAAWRDWMARHNITKSSLSIGQAGTVLHSAGEIRNPDIAYPMASLSKAVTAMCLNHVLTDSAYAWDSTLADLAPEFRKMNVTPDDAVADLTLAQIATHTSGFPKILSYGSTSLRAQTLSSQPTMARAALKEEANFGPRGPYVYSNANYAIMGLLIEAMTGKPYAEDCGDRIMTPAGATEAAVSGRMAYTAGYGGWSVSTEDYARFAMHWFDPAQPWMTSPQDFAHDDAARYGMGTSVHSGRAGIFVSHYGRWTHKDPRKPNIGALFFVRADGATVVVNWDTSVDFALYDELLAALEKAL